MWWPALQALSITQLLRDIKKVPENIRQPVINNGGGHANHSLFWTIMAAGASVARVAAAFGPHQQFSFLKQTRLFVTGAEEYTPGPIFVLNGASEVAGSNQLSTDGGPAPPQNLPQSGSVTYDAKRWLVYSFEPFPPDRIYVLQPA